ncbi:hypothetical protein EGR_11029 [Echinococcus granulosus]|uniref:Uncharacterized protein n=1 Tax=Echinococcus granulosus TaxID=6210 RepID=W6TZH2_ECHGR|nr:hypothetical protein EGR_11029 [Echinococcus granulosus]EUB54113.1 hypothetical protein EGR_11029 [Echinococcus granulosus]
MIIVAKQAIQRILPPLTASFDPPCPIRLATSLYELIST